MNGQVGVEPRRSVGQIAVNAQDGRLRAARAGDSREYGARLGVSSHHAVVDGVPLHWTEQGTGSPLVVLHGLGDSQHSWQAVTSELARRYRVFGLDLPGCGLSGRPDASYGLDWLARTALSWLERMDLGASDVMGHSYGGGVALWLSLYRARAVRKLALVAPGGLGEEVSGWLRLAAVCSALEATGERLSGPMTRLLVELYGRGLPLADRRRLWHMNSLPGTARAFARTVRDVVGWRGQTRQLLERLHDLHELPVMGLFWGEEDRVIPVRHARALCARLENCSLWQLPGAGHFLHWQAPRALGRAVLGFLDAPRLQPARLRAPGATERPGLALLRHASGWAGRSSRSGRAQP